MMSLPSVRWLRTFVLFGAGLMASSAEAQSEAQSLSPSTEPANATCPAGLPLATQCYTGRSDEGAFYWIAVPANWNRTLLVYSHGGPRSGPPAINDQIEDLQRFAVTIHEGYAWIGSSYRRGGYGVRMAAEDTDITRRIFWARFGRPEHTFLHGQSWGGNVAAKAAELYAVAGDGSYNYDGVMLTSGVLGGGTRAYRFRADLRAVYQFYCQNHPRPDEVAYPVWQGLPAGQEMSRADLTTRVDECTGVTLTPSERSPQQAANLRNILAVTGVSEGQLIPHLAWATDTFQDIVQQRLDGANPFSNIDTVYANSDDDVALNVGVERFASDPTALARLAYDADLTGLIVVPTVTIHAKNDPTVSVGLEALYRDTVAAAGRSDLLVQTFTDEAEHGKLSTPEYAALAAALSAWVERGEKPTPASIAQQCQHWAAIYDEPCLFDPDFEPGGPPFTPFRAGARTAPTAPQVPD